MAGSESPAPPAELPGLLPALTPGTAPWLQPDADLELVIFSKDRACQLDGLLRSIRTFLPLPHRVHVLYTTSSDEFENGYDCLRRWHAGIDWIDQGTTFQQHVVALVERIAAGPGRFLMFLVDDMLFTRPFTATPLLTDLAEDNRILAVSLRLGQNIDFCYMRNSRTRPPDFTRGHRWAWKTASPGYWDYPMSTDGNIYRARDLVEYMRRLRFKNPSTMEAHMARDPLPHPDLVCEATPCVINLAANVVQSTFPNRHGNVSAASLNGAFLAGFALDVRPFVGKRFSACHIEAEMPLIADPRPRASRGEPLPSGARRRIDLRDIPCFVINLPEDVEKRRAMEKQLSTLGMRYEIVQGIKADPGWIGVALAHLKVLRLTRAEPPFLVLEDDCEFNRHFEPVIEVPAEAAALYLGVSMYGLREPGQRSWGVESGTQWEQYDAAHVRVHNMLARHAVLYLSSAFQQAVIAAQVEALTNRSFAHPGDIGLAMQQATHLVLTPNRPVCRQRGRPETARSLREMPARQPRSAPGPAGAAEPAAGEYRTLTELANRFGTDKGTTRGCAHHYTRVYDVLFAPLRLQPIALLEIGLAIGGPEHGAFDRRPEMAPSVATWLAYFPQGHIYGFDYSDFSHLVSERFHFVRGDCGVEADLDRLTGCVPALDVVLDDGSHASYHQQLAFRHLFPKLKPGGLYIIEDLFWQSPAYERALPAVERSRIVFHQILASAAPFRNAVFAPDQVEGYRRDIAAFEFFGWLGGPVRPPGDLRAGDLAAAKLLVMRRRD